MKEYNKKNWVSKEKAKMKFKADWFKEDRKDNLPNLQDAFIAFEFDKEKFGDTLKNQMEKMKRTMHGVGWGEIAVYQGQYKAETNGNILLFGKFELGQKLNEEKKKKQWMILVR